MSQLTMIAQALQLAREAIDALRENATASRELAAEYRRHKLNGEIVAVTTDVRRVDDA